MNVELDKLYSCIIPNVSFGNLDSSELNKLFADGRVASHFMEIQITKWFPELERKEVKRGRAKSDHIDKSGNMYEMKSLTKCGCKLMPSYQYGGSRTFDYDEYKELAEQTRYIICDIRAFPMVTVVFKKGEDLAKMFPKGLVSLKESELLYAGLV